MLTTKLLPKKQSGRKSTSGNLILQVTLVAANSLLFLLFFYCGFNYLPEQREVKQGNQGL